MKNFLFVVFLFTASFAFSQDNIEITPENSWFKAGITLGAPIGDTADFSSLTLGTDLRAQYLVNPNFGIGVVSGYNHFFGKDDFDDFGLIPLAGFARYYQTSRGLFFGADFGYGFLTSANDNKGGLYVNPQIGYHDVKWNLYGFYQNTFAENEIDIKAIGIGATYNIMF